MDLAELDARRSPRLAARLPGLTRAFDGRAMNRLLQASLFGARDAYVIEDCKPGKAQLDDDGCTLRYDVRLRESATGRCKSAMITGRLFADADACADFFEAQVRPLADAAEGRTELDAFDAAVALLPTLGLVVHAYPIDPSLPALLEASDPVRMKEVIGGLLARSIAPDLAVDDCQVGVAHYPRRHRCVLRYQITGTSRGRRESMVVFGKLTAPPEPPPDEEALRRLRRMLEGDADRTVRTPRVVGSLAKQGLVLIEGIPGAPAVGSLVKAADEHNGHAEAPALDDAVALCATVAAMVHATDVSTGPVRALEAEVARLRRDVLSMEAIGPKIASYFLHKLKEVEDLAPTREDRLVFGHGDFTHSQVLFDGVRCGLIDFDNLCQAEPELDLGQFCAYLGAAILKPGRTDEMRTGLRSRIKSHFLRSYIDAGGESDPHSLGGRVGDYERVSLLRMSIRAWYQLKPARCANALAALEQAEIADVERQRSPRSGALG